VDVHRLSVLLFGGPPATPATPAAPPGGPSPGGRPHRLLLIDDTPFFLEVVRRYLSEQGHEVEAATNGREGLERILVGPPFDLIVSDIEMPVMDGWEFAREVRRRGHRTPMLALTSLAGASHEARARECGFDDYEVKLDHDRLVRKVSGLLAAREGRE
jgi:two-component system chemotaxis sensor kinase CheA